MREQKAQLIPRRASAPGEDRHYTVRTASPNRGGGYASQTPTRRPQQVDTEDDEIYDQRSRSSAVRYRPLNEDRQERGVVTYEQPSQPASPKRQRGEPEEQRKKSWLFYVGIAFLIMLVGWVLISLLGILVQRKMDDWTYGYPRTYQVDTSVGHNGRESHFIAINLRGQLEVIETQKNHPEVTKIYAVVTLPEDQQYTPVTLTFQDLRGSGRLDMLVHYGNTEIPLYNDGSQFQMQPPASQ